MDDEFPLPPSVQNKADEHMIIWSPVQKHISNVFVHPKMISIYAGHIWGWCVKNIPLHCFEVFVWPVSSLQNEEEGIFELYHSQPLGGTLLPLDSLLGSLDVFYLSHTVKATFVSIHIVTRKQFKNIIRLLLMMASDP